MSRREFWAILYQLLGGGMSIFLTTAYMDEAERAHRIGLLHRGRLLVADTLTALKEKFQGELLQVHAPDLHAAKQALAAHPLAHQVLARGDRLLVTVDHAAATLKPFEEILQQAGQAEARLEKVEPGLEDLFVQMVEQQGG